MEELELFYVAGNDFYVWERLEELFTSAKFEDLEDLIELEPVMIRSMKGNRKELKDQVDALLIEYDDLIKIVSEEDIYLLYYSYQS